MSCVLAFHVLSRATYAPARPDQGALVNMNSITLTQMVLAQAGGAGGGGASAITNLFPIILMVGVIYFLLIRPASKQRKEHQALLNTLKKGDEVVTSGGIYGRVVSIEDGIAMLEIADKTKIRILRERIAGRWKNGQVEANKQ